MSKILFASMPFDGHFNPLTGLAVHLKGRGHDVRFYAGPAYAKKLAALEIPHFDFVRAKDVNALNLEQHFPEYGKLGAGPKAIEFALRNIFFASLEGHYRDICGLYSGGFAFDALICDGALYASTLLAEKLRKPVYAVWPAQTPAPTGRNVPPPFFGLKPATSIFGRIRDAVVHAMVNRLNNRCRPLLNDLRAKEGLAPYVDSVWDIHNRTAAAMFQVGAPGFDYPRSDWPAQHMFVGALMPHRTPPDGKSGLPAPLEEKLARYPKLIVVSQGTVDNRDPEKLLVPALEALKGGPHLVVATTGHRNTDALAQRFPEDNVFVADWIDFHPLLEQADLLISNGGYGSVMHAFVKGVPVVVAGKLEGKNDINARVDYCGLGVNLGTERPKPKQIAAGVAQVLADSRYQARVQQLQKELASYDTFGLIEARLAKDGIV